MFRKFHEKLKEREEGFTLIELLVVILIIAILAAIAIPVFLRQREKGWIGQNESALKNAATAQESYATGAGNGTYTTVEAALESEGFRQINDVELTIPTGNATYCLQVVHARLTAAGHPSATMHLDSEAGAPEDGGC